MNNDLLDAVEELPTRLGYRCPECGEMVHSEHGPCMNDDCDVGPISLADEIKLIPKDAVIDMLEDCVENSGETGE